MLGYRLSCRAIRSIEPKRYATARFLHLIAQSNQLIFTNDMRLLDMDRLAVFYCLNRIFGMGRVVRGNVDEVDVWVVDDFVGIVGVVAQAILGGQRRGPMDIDVHAATHDSPTFLAQIVGDIAEREIAASENADMPVGILGQGG